ncbi:MAG: hypothetical protein FJY73_08920 [Candidatus Eisenbacteria bacterium]|nr:hypothetical protein [Candidatus Eisenbacteria bacterium]
MKLLSIIGSMALAGLLAAGAGCGGEETLPVLGDLPPEPETPGPTEQFDPDAGRNTTNVPAPPGQGTATCEKNAYLRIGAYAVTNNKHGESRLEEGDVYAQCVAIGSAGFPASWRWEVRTRRPYVKGFPQIAFGTNPWTRVATSKQLPVRVGDLSTLLVEHQVAVAADGLYNLAFDLWLTEDDTPHQNERTNEIMIWLDGSIPVVSGKVGSVSIDGADYDFHVQQFENGVPLLLFAAHEPRPSGRTNLLEFLRYLETNGYVSPDVYLSIVELGTEMWWGRGEAVVKEYSVLLERE